LKAAFVFDNSHSKKRDLGVVTSRIQRQDSHKLCFIPAPRHGRTQGYNTEMKILFLHGWKSVPGGVKPTYLAEHGHEVSNPALPDEDFGEALRIAQAEYDKHKPDMIVGSSRGGALAMNLNSGDTPLVLLCPAWKKYGTAKVVKPNTVILHSRADDVIPFADSEELVKNSDLPDEILFEIGNDHRLADPESLELMLEACTNNDEADELDDEIVQITTEEAALEYEWRGLCYTAALKWIKVTSDRSWSLVHGTVFSGEVDKRIQHAWCERGDKIVDLVMPVGHRIIDRERYYQILQPQVHKRYSSDDAIFLVIKNRHDGPWEEWEQLRE
jgi:hypothetical protein